MLTADLVRARVSRGALWLRRIEADDPATLAEAAALIALFEGHVGRRRAALEDALADHIGDATDFMVRRGLIKLLTDRAVFEVQAAAEPAAVRAAVFDAAMAAWPVGPAAGAGEGGHLTDRRRVLAEVGEALGLSLEEVEGALYADLAAEEVLTGGEWPEPRALLQRYDLGLAQAVLFKAREVVVELDDPAPARTRQLLRIIRFHRLMHRAERTEEGWRVVLDGPLSLFKQTQRYGLQLAKFLPSLCHCPRWRLAADVVWGKGRLELRFELDQDAGLVTHTKDLGTWESEEERHFRRVWAKQDTPWKLRRATEIVDLDGRGALVPAYVLRHPDGRKALLEIVWFWQRRTFLRRLELLRDAGPSNLVIALATRMNVGMGGDGELPDVGGAALYPFKGVIQPKRVIALAEEVGR